MKKLGIIGAGGHGKVVADIASNFYDEIVFFDDTGKTCCLDYKVIGLVDDAKKYLNDMDFFVAIGDGDARKRIFNNLESVSAKIATLVHPKAIVSNKKVEIGVGSVVVAGAVINAGAKIGKGVIINTCSSVDHDCVVEDFSHVAVGARVAGAVKLGKNVWLGANATIINGLEVCDNCIIGAGAVVIKDIKEQGTYVGVPVKKFQKAKK